jgi:hypothetical protein
VGELGCDGGAWAGRRWVRCSGRRRHTAGTASNEKEDPGNERKLWKTERGSGAGGWQALQWWLVAIRQPWRHRAQGFTQKRHPKYMSASAGPTTALCITPSALPCHRSS